MEYNFTKEMKQPHKIYSDKLPIFSEGIRVEYLIVFGIFIVLSIIMILISLVFDISIIQYMFKNGWLLILSGIGLITWILFTLEWDKKSFFGFLSGRIAYKYSKGKTYEHGGQVKLNQKHYKYRPFKQNRTF